MSHTYMTLDEWCALTPEERRKFTKVKFDFWSTPERLQSDHQKDRDAERRTGFTRQEREDHSS